MTVCAHKGVKDVESNSKPVEGSRMMFDVFLVFPKSPRM